MQLIRREHMQTYDGWSTVCARFEITGPQYAYRSEISRYRPQNGLRNLREPEAPLHSH